MIEAVNGNIACEAPENRGVERQVVGGVSLAVHQSSLKQFKVVYGSKTILAGSTIWVPYIHTTNQKWAIDVHEINGKKVVFVPEGLVLLVASPE